MRDLEASGTVTPQCEPELDASASSSDSGYSSQFPCRIDSNTDSLYHASSSTTYDTSITDNPCRGNVYRDILDYLEHVCCNGSLAGCTERDNSACSWRLQSVRSCSVDGVIPTANDYSDREHCFQPSPPPTSCVLLDTTNEPMTSSFHALHCLDFSDAPQQTASTWRSNYSAATKTTSEQTLVSVGVPGQFTSSLTPASRQRSESDNQQHSAINTSQLQYSSEDDAKFRTLQQPDLTGDFIPTSPLKTADTSSHNHFATTSDSSQVVSASVISVHLKSPAISCSRHVFLPAEPQPARRRRLFNDVSRYPNHYGYRMCQKSPQEQGCFRQSESRTSCAVLESEHLADKPFAAASQLQDSDRRSACVIQDVGTCCQNRFRVTPTVRYDTHEERCSATANSRTHPNFAPGQIGSTQTLHHCRSFDDISRNTTDEGYGVRRNSQQQHHDVFQSSSPRTPCVAAYSEGRATTPTWRNASPGEVPEEALMSCRRRLFDETTCYRVRKTSAAAHRCEVCDRTYTRLSTLRGHIRAVHSTAPKPHVCAVCGRRFTQLSNLDAHRRIHTGLYRLTLTG